jgi:hypothetical protein
MILESVQQLDFNKNTNDEWFVDLPDYPGNKEDLQMVGGADILLDVYSGNTSNVSLFVNTDGIQYGDTLKYLERANFDGKEYGAFYIWNDQTNDPIWLCDVVEWLFGGFPPVIYLQKCLN